MLSRAPLYCLCLLALLSTATSQSTDGPLVTSVSGCTDTGSTTVDCVLPVYLTVRGSGFLTNLTTSLGSYNSPQPWISVLPELSPAAVATNFTQPTLRAASLFPANDTYFVVQLINLGRDIYPAGVSMSLTVLLGNGYPALSTKSTPFVGLSITPTAPPVISAISGCPMVGADGQSVTQCLPDVNSVTLTGSGFLQWQYTRLAVYIGAIQTSYSLQLGIPSDATISAIVSDTVLVLSLATAFDYELQQNDFGAPPRPFHVKEWYSDWQSQQMSIQFAALPPPSYSAIAPFTFFYLPLLPSCVWGPNRTTIVNCTAGHSPVVVVGQYLYETSVTVGGQPTTPFLHIPSSVTRAYRTLPLYNFQPGLLYDLVLSSAAGSVTVPNYISFSGTPGIVSAACRDPLLPSDVQSLACTQGETITLNGPYLPPPSTTFTVTVTSGASGQNVTCSNPRYNSEYQLACDMLVAGEPSISVFDTLYVQWANGLSITLEERYDVWDEPTAPRIRNISAVGGCGNVLMSGNVTLSGCRGGETLQLYGTHFLTMPFVMAILATTSDSYAIVNYGYLATCEQLDVVSDTYATCVLPLVADYSGLQYNTPYMMLLWNDSLYSDDHKLLAYRTRSNALFFQYNGSDSSIVPAPASSSSPSLALMVALPVALGLLAVVVVAATVRQLRSKAWSTRRGPSAEATDVYGEQKEAEQQHAERGGISWWQSSRLRSTLASQGEVRGVELVES